MRGRDWAANSRVETSAKAGKVIPANKPQIAARIATNIQFFGIIQAPTRHA